MTSLQDVVRVGPRVADILNLPPRSQILYAVGASTLGFMFHVAVMRGVRYVHYVVTKGQDFTLRDESCHPRLVLSAVLRAVLANASAVGFEWVYANVPVVAKAVAGFVWGMRRAVGLPGTAPYGELSGGTPLVNVLAGGYELERMYNGYFPIPTIGVMGINAKPLTAEQTAEIFAPAGGNPEGLPLRFLTPTRLVRVALQFSIGNVAVQLFRRYVVPMITGVPNHMRKPRSLPTTLANPFILLIAMAIVRDAESVSVFGTRWQIGLVGVCAVLVAPVYIAAEFVASLVVPSQVQVTDENYPILLDEIVADYLPELPINYMSPYEVATIQDATKHTLMGSMRAQMTPQFLGGLAVLSTILFSFTAKDEFDERPVPAKIRVKLCHWNDLNDADKVEFLLKVYRSASDRIYDAFTLDHTNFWGQQLFRGIGLSMLSIKDAVEIMDSVATLPLEKKSSGLLLLQMGQIWGDLQKQSLLGGMGSIVATAEDMACMVMAPAHLDPLFPEAFANPVHHMWLPRPTNPIQAVGRYPLRWLHLQL